MDQEDGYEEISEEEVTEPVARVVRKQTQPKAPVEEPIEEVIQESRYVAYKSPAIEGVIDTETNLPIGTETNVILAEILNKLDNIEKSTA